MKTFIEVPSAQMTKITNITSHATTLDISGSYQTLRGIRTDLDAMVVIQFGISVLLLLLIVVLTRRD